MVFIAFLYFPSGEAHRTVNIQSNVLEYKADKDETESVWKRLTHRHQAKRGESSCAADAVIVTDIVTTVDSVTYEFEDVIVYIDDEGKPVSTTTIYRNLVSSTQGPPPESTPASSPAPAPAPSPSSQAPVPPLASSSPIPNPSQAPAPEVNPKEAPDQGVPSPKPAASTAGPPPATSESTAPVAGSNEGEGSKSSSGPGFESAISYTPYNSDNSCKTTQQVATDLGHVTDYEVLRLYGTDCNQIANVLAATKGKVQLFLGIFDINSISDEVKTMSSALNGNWGIVNAVNVGNELINSGTASAGQVTAAIGTARAALKAAGYSGPVVTVDTMIAMKNNPSLCQASDFCAINCHAFFDGKTLPSGAGQFVKDWAQQGMIPPISDRISTVVIWSKS